ncbi:alpha/beta fold hydrolase [Mesonia aestuariivivens]|uniref:Alpha/beta hydrolase n=1 Tax=Mesonia aestuariivivens TaxID=2796128 RepID=A0ABS6W2F4_9FLAO|nr:alpha/beta hydrolase [Mesonia aestuariivivens]MBW2962028.1 alpha/beta hydrolase [Mesonia aestuariivivens]
MKAIISLLFIFLGSNLAIAQKNQIKNLAIDLSNYEYPYEVAFYNFEAQQQNLKMAYIDEKPNKWNGQTVVLLHGKNFNIAYWETTIELLKKNHYRVVAPDQIGFGKSTKPKYFQYTFQQLAENTKNLLSEIKVENPIILGHSMGGMLAARFTLMYPNYTKQLVLVNPIGLEDWKLKVPYQSIDNWYEGELKKDYKKIKNYQKESYYDGDWKPEYDEWVNILAGWTKNENYPLIAWNAALTYDMVFTQPVVYEFSEIKVPTLLIIGTRDRTALGKGLVSKDVKATMGLYDELGKATAKKIPNSKLEEISNVGHLPHIEAFEKFKEKLIPNLLK